MEENQLHFMEIDNIIQVRLHFMEIYETVNKDFFKKKKKYENLNNMPQCLYSNQ